MGNINQNPWGNITHRNRNRIRSLFCFDQEATDPDATTPIIDTTLLWRHWPNKLVIFANSTTFEPIVTNSQPSTANNKNAVDHFVLFGSIESPRDAIHEIRRILGGIFGKHCWILHPLQMSPLWWMEPNFILWWKHSDHVRPLSQVRQRHLSSVRQEEWTWSRLLRSTCGWCFTWNWRHSRMTSFYKSTTTRNIIYLRDTR